MVVNTLSKNNKNNSTSRQAGVLSSDFSGQDKLKLEGWESLFFSSDKNIYIHPLAIIGPGVFLESGVKIGPFCSIVGNVHIGKNTRIYPHVTIGYPGQVLGLTKCYGSVQIGSSCEIREFVSIHSSRAPEGKTVIGDNCYIMNFSHIAHDCYLENNVTLINNVSLGGHTHVEHNAFLMAYVATHQFCRIGQFASLAPFSATRQDLPPFCLFDGQPASFAGLNKVALNRAGFSSVTCETLKHITYLFYLEKLSLEKIYDKVNSDIKYKSEESVDKFLSFIVQSKRGVSRRTITQVGQRSKASEFME
jgi:UDP-N-acetylglucosamine acyltransferase